MSDDSPPERSAIHNIWTKATPLLCTFHFLQSRWMYLWGAKNGIHKDDRPLLIGLLKDMVFAETVDELYNEVHEQFICNKTVQKYPNFEKYVETFWLKGM